LLYEITRYKNLVRCPNKPANFLHCHILYSVQISIDAVVSFQKQIERIRAV
jgi:hypothetical protein